MVNEENCCGQSKFMIVYFYSLVIQTVENFSGRQENPSWFIGKHPLKLLPCIELITVQSILLKFNMFLLYWCFLILPFRSNGCSSTFGFFCCCWYIYVNMQFVSDCTILIVFLNSLGTTLAESVFQSRVRIRSSPSGSSRRQGEDSSRRQRSHEIIHA